MSGEVLLQFTLIDTTDPAASHEQAMEKLRALVRSVPVSNSQTSTPAATAIPQTDPLAEFVEDDDDDISDYEEDSPEDGEGEGEGEGEDPSKPETAEKRRRRLRIRGLKRKNRRGAYAFTNSDSDVVGIIYLEIARITDLPPESNLTHTSFDMDPFVVASLGRKTYRTRRVRHNLNPVFNEKMIFQLLAHEKSYSFAFTVIDHDKYSGNDFIASCSLPVQDLVKRAPQANPETGLYELRELPEQREALPAPAKTRLQKMGLSRTPSSQSLATKKSTKAASTTSTASQVPSLEAQATSNPSMLVPPETQSTTVTEPETNSDDDDPEFYEFSVPLKMENTEKWESKHSPVIYLRAKYVPYPALRQQFWRAMLRQYDTDDSGRISRIELTTMLDTLGSTLKDSTIDSFFQRFPHKAADNEDSWDLTFDEVVICLEDQLTAKSKPQSATDKIKNVSSEMKNLAVDGKTEQTSPGSGASTPSDEGGAEFLEKEESGDEHVVEIRECPICHQPRLNKRKDSDIITHIATCASQDWRQVKTVLMGGFVTASQAQRKWYSKVITKISYGGYKLGANSANILVQDRITGQINEEKMSVYVRLGIRMLYKGLKSRDMENKQIRKMLKNLSIKQGRKFDDPASKDEIEKFIAFHRLNMDEVLLPLDQFQNFNEFFYRALKPDARPCSAPNNPAIIVSPADCRSVVFNQMSQATKIWVKGREFNMKRLLGEAYPDDVARFEGGGLGIFRLAPQDYHRFHIPVDGVMGEPKTIAGEYYTVNPMAIRSALDVYGENVRVVVPIDSEVHGRVMVICVGAMMVGSTVITRQPGEKVKRAEELGYFKFGGSTILLLFEPGKMRFDSDLTENANGALETLVSVEAKPT